MIDGITAGQLQNHAFSAALAKAMKMPTSSQSRPLTRPSPASKA